MCLFGHVEVGEHDSPDIVDINVLVLVEGKKIKELCVDFDRFLVGAAEILTHCFFGEFEPLFN